MPTVNEWIEFTKPKPQDMKDMKDNVNKPAHYNFSSIECIQAIKAALTPEEFRGYCKGNAIKYVWRELYKGGDESLKKAVWHLEREVEQSGK